ncbi:MarR family winged helix-turn-helix transcriptional regulator [Vibrio sonorensis]|uniref:MarR family winged helix-turn-helix transcriptional regulator n=1 Tax=Vibrio sonorensis TaxID=1004316 RepID=UPI001113ED02|nr:MarR family winged helix-turn-helix transcriptional regulator [Vibrio sonorensis]
MDTKTQVDKSVDRFFAMVNRVHAIDQKPQNFGTDVLLHRAEIHTIEVIGKHRDLTTMSLAHLQNVTKGAASQMISKLVKKGMLERLPSPHSKKEWLLALTEKGKVAFEHHEAFHDSMNQQFQQHFGEGLVPFLTDLNQVIDQVESLIDHLEK